MAKIKLQSYDGEVFEVPVEVIESFGAIKAMMDSNVQDNYDAVIPLPNVSAPILRKILQWATHNCGDFDEYVAEYRRTLGPSDWDREFLDVDQGMLFEILQAANYLDIRGLEFLLCQNLADMMRDKSPEEIRAAFGVQNDLTESEMKDLEEKLPCED